MAEGARLESVFRVKPNEGSNPSLSAKYKKTCVNAGFFVFGGESRDERSQGSTKNFGKFLLTTSMWFTFFEGQLKLF